jgi:hypothetical protein
MSSQTSEEIEQEAYPEGYAEAMADCTVLAVRLLKLALTAVREETN